MRCAAIGTQRRIYLVCLQSHIVMQVSSVYSLDSTRLSWYHLTSKRTIVDVNFKLSIRTRDKRMRGNPGYQPISGGQDDRRHSATTTAAPWIQPLSSSPTFQFVACRHSCLPCPHSPSLLSPHRYQVSLTPGFAKYRGPTRARSRVWPEPRPRHPDSNHALLIGGIRILRQ